MFIHHPIFGYPIRVQHPTTNLQCIGRLTQFELAFLFLLAYQMPIDQYINHHQHSDINRTHASGHL